MIPRDFITEWRAHAPWVADVQVEQDLVICRALVELFSRPLIARSLAFRGGTALYKLHLRPEARYSEDIDLVQIDAGPIGAVLAEVRAALDAWLGAPRWKQSEGRVTLTYRFESEDVPPLPMKLKVEINSREHFTVLGHRHVRFEVASRRFAGGANVCTYELDERLSVRPYDIEPLLQCELDERGTDVHPRPTRLVQMRLVALNGARGLRRNRVGDLHLVSRTSGVAVSRLELPYLLAFALAVAFGLRYLGVLLMGALVIIPAAPAKHLARSLQEMLAISVAVAALSTLAGEFIAHRLGRPSGPVIIVVAGKLFLLSLPLRRIR